MAEAKPLKAGSTGFEQFLSTDTIPATALPARSTISPSQITSDQDNYSPTGWADADVVRLDFDTGGRAITGFAAWTNGRPKVLLNISGNYGYIPAEHPDSTAANRAIGTADHIIPPYGSLTIEYDGTSSRVRVVSTMFNAAVLGFGNLRGHYYYASAASATAGDWGDFAFNQSGTGAALGTAASTATQAGGWQLAAGTTTTGACAIFFAKNLLNPAFFGAAHLIVSFYIRIPTLSDGTQTFTTSVGLVPTPSSAALDVNNSVVVKYSSGLNSGKFLAVSRDNAGAETTADTGITVAADTGYVVTVCIDKARSEARYYIDGVFVARITANIPASAATGQRAVIVKSAGTTSRTLVVASLMFNSIF
jgi:hypothetical protein